MARRLESLTIDGPAGRLEALLEEPDHRQAHEVALLCHPHPLFGGTMHNKVVYRIARALRVSGCAVLRFNFRGVGLSQGEHAHMTGEIEDARAALAWLRARYPYLPYTLAGFSFGSRVATRLGCSAGRASRLIAVGFPTRIGSAEYLEHCDTPKVFIQSTHDEHAPRLEMETLYSGFAQPKRLLWVEAADHFFEGALDALEANVREAAGPEAFGKA